VRFAENVTPPAFFVDKSSMIMCCTNEILPGGVALLLVPRHPISMHVENGDHVGEPVAVHVVDAHHAAAHNIAAIAREGLRMIRPRLLLASGRRLFPPAERVDDIHAARRR
jgi:hypothetical protein